MTPLPGRATGRPLISITCQRPAGGPIEDTSRKILEVSPRRGSARRRRCARRLLRDLARRCPACMPWHWPLTDRPLMLTWLARVLLGTAMSTAWARRDTPLSDVAAGRASRSSWRTWVALVGAVPLSYPTTTACPVAVSRWGGQGDRVLGASGSPAFSSPRQVGRSALGRGWTGWMASATACSREALVLDPHPNILVEAPGGRRSFRRLCWAYMGIWAEHRPLLVVGRPRCAVRGRGKPF